MCHLEYEILFQQMPDYQLLHHYEHFNLLKPTGHVMYQQA